jgi:PKHD-type hydroxylase
VYRKLSVTVQLSAPGDYEGGDFHLRDLYNKKDITLKGTRDRGTIIVFPSILLHRVTPVTEGHRYSLVQWYDGPDFV